MRRRRTPVVLHNKVPHSVMLQRARQRRLRHPGGDHAKGLELLQELADSSPDNTSSNASAAEGAAGKAKQVSEMVADLQTQADVALNSNEEERDMLQTQMLSTAQSLHVIRQFAQTVRRMQLEVERMESHEKNCRKKVDSIRQNRQQRAEDAYAANTVRVLG
eukprot:SRR837773.11869.p1 GENE.SRR837773.11869~~SRR837773.11869.p1  ORF type:complete len:162 (-),score=48.26 SRR837773.11869:20-505(-)